MDDELQPRNVGVLTMNDSEKRFDRLELSTETIRELSGEELADVAGGVQPPTLQAACLTGDYTRWCPTFATCAEVSTTC